MGNELQTVSSNPAMLLQMAVENGADLDKLEKLMDLQERWEASESRKAYSDAMAGFQSKLEPIVKKRDAHNSKYADIDDIAQSSRPILAEFGLASRLPQEQQDNTIRIICGVTHKRGHQDQTS